MKTKIGILLLVALLVATLALPGQEGQAQEEGFRVFLPMLTGPVGEVVTEPDWTPSFIAEMGGEWVQIKGTLGPLTPELEWTTYTKPGEDEPYFDGFVIEHSYDQSIWVPVLTTVKGQPSYSKVWPGNVVLSDYGIRYFRVKGYMGYGYETPYSNPLTFDAFWQRQSQNLEITGEEQDGVVAIYLPEVEEEYVRIWFTAAGTARFTQLPDGVVDYGGWYSIDLIGEEAEFQFEWERGDNGLLWLAAASTPFHNRIEEIWFAADMDLVPFPLPW